MRPSRHSQPGGAGGRGEGNAFCPGRPPPIDPALCVTPWSIWIKPRLRVKYIDLRFCKDLERAEARLRSALGGLNGERRNPSTTGQDRQGQKPLFAEQAKERQQDRMKTESKKSSWLMSWTVSILCGCHRVNTASFIVWIMAWDNSRLVTAAPPPLHPPGVQSGSPRPSPRVSDFRASIAQ